MNNHNLKRIFFTYEGHFSEAFLIEYSRRCKIKTIAYNHSYFYNFQREYRNLHYKSFKPDIVLLTGRYIKKKIKFSSNQKIIVIGSNKIIDNKSKIKNFHKKSYTCLVLGDDVELTRRLFDIIYDIAKKNSNIKFNLKLHPSVKINQVIDNQEKFFSQNNIKLVEKRIEELFKEAKWVIYQRTTGVINAINFNVRPLYCDNLEISLDPLGEIKIWKKVLDPKNNYKKYY